MARLTAPVRAVAYPLHPDESLVKDRRPGPGVQAPPEGTLCADQAGGGVDGQHQREGSSRRDGGAKPNGPQALGQARGGWPPQSHRVAADARTAVMFSLSPGPAQDAPEGCKLLRRLGGQREPVPLVRDRA